MNGGYETMASFGPDVPAEVLRWAEGLPTVHEDAHRFYVHAGFRPGRPGPAPVIPIKLNEDCTRPGPSVAREPKGRAFLQRSGREEPRRGGEKSSTVGLRAAPATIGNPPCNRAADRASGVAAPPLPLGQRVEGSLGRQLVREGLDQARSNGAGPAPAAHQ